LFVGKHNFKKFTANKIEEKEEEGMSFERTIDAIECKQEDVFV